MEPDLPQDLIIEAFMHPHYRNKKPFESKVEEMVSKAPIYTDYSSELPAKCAAIDYNGLPLKTFMAERSKHFSNTYSSKSIYNEKLIELLCKDGQFILKNISEHGKTFFFFYKGSLVCVSEDESGFRISMETPSDSELHISEFDEFKLDDKKSRVSILIKTSYGLETKSLKIEAPKIPDLNLNYGDGFAETHTKIVSKLNATNASILFFHGDPGCGKSFYIKYLTGAVEKEFIFIPVAYAGELSSPDFISLLLEHKDSIIILEDSEKVVQSRALDDYNVSTVSTLLNMSDGILGSMLNIKIIATYNGDKSKVDQALLRKGRLSIDHTFSKLSVENANKLAKTLNKADSFTTPQSLADIYNMEDVTGYVAPVERKMGFGA